MIYFFGIIIGYIIGSISPSIIITKYLTGNDIRNHGSGNAGATNVMRVLGWKVGIPVFLFDVSKSFAVVEFLPILFKNIFPTFEINIFTLKILSGFGVISGHVWTIFGNFRGGKGVATMLGFMLAIAPFDFFMTVIVFLIVTFIFKYVSLGSIFASISFPISLIIRKYSFYHEIKNFDYLLIFSLIIPILIIFTHRKNIKRIINGNENKISIFKKSNKEKS